MIKKHFKCRFKIFFNNKIYSNLKLSMHCKDQKVYVKIKKITKIGKVLV